MKLKDSIFFGFSQEELEAVRRVKGNGDREMAFSDFQGITDIVGANVMVLIIPGKQIVIIKAGE